MSAVSASAPAPTDPARPVRPGEELDAGALDRWLKGQLPSLKGTPHVAQYPGGASNWTYRLQYEDRTLVLRRPPAGTKAKSAHDMGREYRVQAALRPAYPFVPEVLAFCADPSVLGCEFYVMEQLEGVILRAHTSASQLGRQPAHRLCYAMFDRLVDLHRVDADACGLAAIGKGEGYAKRQIDGWCRRYEKARTWNAPAFERVKAWLKAHTPDDAGACVIHNDYRLDNLVLDKDDLTRIVGVLDWEMATVGCPLMDLGTSLAYWVEKDDHFVLRLTRRQPSQLPGMLRRREIVEYYCDRMGLSSQGWVFYEVYGLFRLAAIIQQIYYRYVHRQTQNSSFRHYWLLLHYLDHRCRKLIRNNPERAV